MTEKQNQEETLEESAETEELDPREVELAKEHGLIEEEKQAAEEKTEESEAQTEENKTTEESEEEPEIEEKIKKGEDLTEEEENKVHEWAPDKKAMYWKWKTEKQKRQTEARKKELLEIKAGAKDKKIQELEEKVKKYQSGEIDDASPDDLITREEALKMMSQKTTQSNDFNIEDKEREYKYSLAEEAAFRQTAKDPSFVKIQNVMAQVAKQDEKIANELIDRVNRLGQSEYAEDDLINFIYRSVERSGIKIEDSSKGIKDEKVERMIKNSTKPPSSASFNSGTETAKTIEDFEITDIMNMSDEAYRALPEEKKEYLLRKFG
jgi:hypothetical protein